MSDYQDWCNSQSCSHGHCPRGCEHPQPQTTTDGRIVCGKCWFDDRELVDMAPCRPDNCPDA